MLSQQETNTDILMIYPPFHRLFGEQKTWMPLGLTYLATYLNSTGIKALVYNADCTSFETEKVMTYRERFFNAKVYQDNLDSDNEIWEEIKSILERYKPKIVGISALTEALGSVAKTIEIIRKFDKNITIIIGGPHADIDKEYFINELGADFVIQGEGEKPLKELVHRLLRKPIYETNKLDEMSDDEMDSILNLIPNIEYCINVDKKNLGRKLYISTSRGGCYYNCGFCHSSLQKRVIRHRPVESVINEIKFNINTYRTKKIFFIDDTFTHDLDFVLRMCEEIIKQKIDFKWTCTTRVNKLDYKILKKMKCAGCESIHIGVESGSKRILDMITKGINSEDIINCSKLIKSNQIECRIFIMVGFPTENSNDIQDTIKIIEKVEPGEVALNFYVPVPKTELYNQINEKFINLEKIDWCKFSRDKLRYKEYMDDADGKLDDAILKLFDSVEKTNQIGEEV